MRRELKSYIENELDCLVDAINIQTHKQRFDATSVNDEAHY